MKMVTKEGPSRQSPLSNSEKRSISNKPIPFLRRLRDMLLENEDSISFVPGHRRGGERFLGRIVVHDRIKVEGHVLPRYFNHSSFASLRRQLNYFKFVRLAKKRGNEDSTYVNPSVVELDDVLTLKRHRPKDSTQEDADSFEYETSPRHEKLDNGLTLKRQSPKKDSREDEGCHEEKKCESVDLENVFSLKIRRPSHRREAFHEGEKAPRTINVFSAFYETPQSEDHPSSSLAATRSEQYDDRNDPELLRCCHALLGLSGKGWNNVICP